MTICSVYPIENYNRGMGGNSNFARPMLPTYRGCTVLVYSIRVAQKQNLFQISFCFGYVVSNYNVFV